MKINNKLDLMLELNQIEKQLKSVKSIVSSSNKHATDCYDFSMTTEEVQNLLVLVARLNEEVQDLKGKLVIVQITTLLSLVVGANKD